MTTFCYLENRSTGCCLKVGLSVCLFVFFFKNEAYFLRGGVREAIWEVAYSLDFNVGMTSASICEIDFLCIFFFFLPRYKILFLDVLFPLHVKKIIFVDADLVSVTQDTQTHNN